MLAGPSIVLPCMFSRRAWLARRGMLTRSGLPSPFQRTVTRRWPGKSKATSYACQLGVNEAGSSGQADQAAVERTSGAKRALRKPEKLCTAVCKAPATGRAMPSSRTIPQTAD